jgi:hypothetical protein
MVYVGYYGYVNVQQQQAELFGKELSDMIDLG